jgi:hypothetical protein
MSKATNTPWLMWGSTQLLEINVPNTTTAPPSNLIATKQTTSLQYGRPDTFEFFFAARVLQANGTALNATFDVAFDVTFGLGRSTVTLINFELYTFTTFPLTVSGGVGSAMIYSNSVTGPPRSVTDLPLSNQIDHLSAQELYCSPRLQLRNIAAANTPLDLIVEVTSYFSPRTHVRPDWYGPQALGSGER